MHHLEGNASPPGDDGREGEKGRKEGRRDGRGKGVLITSVGHGADPGFLAVSLQVTLVINPVVGCHYFPPGPWLLSQTE